MVVRLPIAYVDLDGIGADFIAGVLSALNHSMTEAEFQARRDSEAILKKIFEQDVHFFAKLPPIPEFHKLIAGLDKLPLEWKILTATGQNHPSYKIAREDKIYWLGKTFNIPRSKVIVVERSADKAVYANPQTVLIDDMQYNCDNFTKRGGHAVLVKDIDYRAEDIIESIVKTGIV